MITDPIADLLTRIRNAHTVKHRTVRVRASKAAEGVLEVLKTEGFIESFARKKDENDKFDEIEVNLKYYNNGDPGIGKLKRVSKPGCRVYQRSKDMHKVDNGLGISIISTSRGILSDRQARHEKVGGEVLAHIS